ncbi:hypothetical protein [Fructilactobacillus frigidiflavus]|uniref:hypothetical protein n=1 Tax=Fructilactobacillus frigidiflavus TaxID=3242688 RepID=UPI0037576675
MTVEAIDQKLLKLRKFANFVITPLFVILIAAYFIQKTTTMLVIVLAIVALMIYIPYGIVVCYYVLKRRKLLKD